MDKKEWMQVKAIRMPTNLWVRFKGKYTNKADQRIRELMEIDLLTKPPIENSGVSENAL
jgi:hypothetical protein